MILSNQFLIPLNRGGKRRIPNVAYPQFYVDWLPIGGPEASIGRFDQIQPVGRIHNFFGLGLLGLAGVNRRKK